MNRIIKILVVIMSTTAASFSQTKAVVNPDTLIVLKSGKPIQVDGIISPNEWTDADSMLINVDTNWISTVYYKHNSSHALFAFKDLEKITGNAHVVNLLIDKLNNKSANWSSDDLWIHASYSDCEAIGEYYEWSSCTATDKPGWLANNLPFGNGNDNIEMQINLSKFELNTFPDTLGFGISLGTNVDTINHYWPGTADIDEPSTWGYLIFPKIGNTGNPDSSFYFSQTPPGDSAVIFAPGIISLTDRLEDHITFSPDGNECYFSVWGANYSSAKIFYTKRENNIWSPQVEASFSVGNYAKNPFFSVDGQKLYFDYAGSKPSDIWMVQRASQDWSDPQVLSSPVNSDYADGSYSETTDSTAYFTSKRPGGLDEKGDIWCARHVPGQPLLVENLGAAVNSTVWDASPCIAPDGSYLIFTSERSGGQDNSDLYMSFNKGNNSWTLPINMRIINTNVSEIGPSLSPDGKFLFFTRYTSSGTGETEDIYWVRIDNYIDSLKHSNFIPYLKSQIPNQRDTVGHPFNYQIPDSMFIDDNGNNTLTYSAILNTGNPLPGWLSFDSATRTFSGTPDTSATFVIKVTVTDTVNASASCIFTITFVSGTTGIKENKSQIPVDFALQQNYPNPFNPSTTIRYTLDKPSRVRLSVYNVLGQRIRVLQNGFQNAGEHSLTWDATDERNNQVSSGVYFYTLETENVTFQKKMILIH